MYVSDIQPHQNILVSFFPFYEIFSQIQYSMIVNFIADITKLPNFPKIEQQSYLYFFCFMLM